MHFHANPSPSQSHACAAHSLTASIETLLPSIGHPMLKGLYCASHFSRARFLFIVSSIFLIFNEDLRFSRRCRPASLIPRSNGGMFALPLCRLSLSFAFNAAPLASLSAMLLLPEIPGDDISSGGGLGTAPAIQIAGEVGGAASPEVNTTHGSES